VEVRWLLPLAEDISIWLFRFRPAFIGEAIGSATLPSCMGLYPAGTWSIGLYLHRQDCAYRYVPAGI